jgi:hypothetical protein
VESYYLKKTDDIYLNTEGKGGLGGGQEYGVSAMSVACRDPFGRLRANKAPSGRR